MNTPESQPAPSLLGVRPCRACGQLVQFARTPERTILPLDMTAPCYFLDAAEGDRLPPARRLRSVYVSHFCTCSSPDQFGKKKRRAAP